MHCIEKKSNLIVLNKVHRILRFGGVSSHNVVIHKGFGSEQTETAGGAHNTSNHMFSCLLQPMTWKMKENVIKFLENILILYGGIRLLKILINLPIAYSKSWYHTIGPLPTGWIRPQAAPKFLFFFIKSTNKLTAGGWKSISPSKVKR